MLLRREGSGQTGALLSTKWFIGSSTNTPPPPTHRLSRLSATHIYIHMDRQGSTHAVCFLADQECLEQIKAFQQLKHLCAYTHRSTCSQSSPSVAGAIHDFIRSTLPIKVIQILCACQGNREPHFQWIHIDVYPSTEKCDTKCVSDVVFAKIKKYNCHIKMAPTPSSFSFSIYEYANICHLTRFPA